nr:MAG TPA: hypothetical protein [Caudoviricetes sp.]
MVSPTIRRILCFIKSASTIRDECNGVRLLLTRS